MRTRYETTGFRVQIAGFLLAVAIIFGGGGSPAPRAELVVQLAALAAVVAWVWLEWQDRAYPRYGLDKLVLVLTCLVIIIPAVQLIPLPPAIWQRLPGRDIEQQALALVGAENAWVPLSMSPTRTLASLLSFTAPMTMLFFVSRLTVRDRSKLLGFLGALGLLSTIVGVIQLASGHANWLRFYPVTNYGFATGFHANRNAQADFLIIASIALTAWASTSRRVERSRQAQLTVGVLVAVLWLSVIVTGSRSGTGMIPIAVIACAAIVVRRWRMPGRKTILAAMAAFAALAAVGIALQGNARIERTLARFGDLQDVRTEIWSDTWYAIGQHWPVGTGMGTFRPVFDAAERLEFVRPTYANRAHNDYLEFALETGIAGVLLLLLVVVFSGYRIVSAFRRDSDRRRRAQMLFVAGSLVALLLHSLVDYPMRTMSLATVAGLMAGLLSRRETVQRGQVRRSFGRSLGGVEG